MAIDLILYSPHIVTDLEWRDSDALHGSGLYPVIVSETYKPTPREALYIMEKAEWLAFWHATKINNEEIEIDLFSVIN